MKCLLCGVALFTFIAFSSCSEEDTTDAAKMLQIYGENYQLEQGAIWHGDNNTVIALEDYTFDDNYQTNEGLVVDYIPGFTAKIKEQRTGNFMLCLYESGFIINETLLTAKGKGAAISLYLSSPDVDKLLPGKYIYALNRDEFTFNGYCSSMYITNVSDPTPAELTEGEVTISSENNIYTVNFKCKTSFGGIVEGRYIGILKEYNVRRDQGVINIYPDIKLEALYDTIRYTDGGIVKQEPDYLRGTAFLRSSKQQVLSAKDFKDATESSKKNIDIALIYDKIDQTVRFESPIKMRSILWHNTFENYNFNLPCHTKYMSAPASFTNENFEKITTNTDFTFKVIDERVTIPIGITNPTFVFVETGLGELGVIRVKRVVAETIEQIGRIVYPVNPYVVLDIKFPKNFSELKMR